MRTSPPAATVAAMRRTVLIVDDHSAFRAAARALLEDAGFQVVGEAEDGESAIAAARELRPDIVHLDIQLPERSGGTWVFWITELPLNGDQNYWVEIAEVRFRS